jgi:hypothetical protein
MEEEIQDIMAASRNVRAATRTTAMLVINSHSGPVLCPFFSKCDGVLLIDQAGKPIGFHQRDRSETQSLCDIILALNPDALVCGFIAEAERLRLDRAGIDVRLGSCRCSIDELFADFHNLPRA